MSGCTEFERMMEALFAGAAGSAEAARAGLLEHAEQCRECGEIYRFHSWLDREAPGLDEPGPDDFEAMRRGVLARLRREAGALARERPSSWWERLLFQGGGAPRPRLATLAAAAAVLVAAGWLLGRTPLGTGDGPVPAAGPLPAMEEHAELLEGPDGLSYQLSNISLEPAAGDLVNLSFDMTRRVRLERAVDDPLVKEALVQSLRGSSPLGSRLKAVSVAGEHMDPAVREALLAVMEHDPSVAVRLRAMETLSRSPSDPSVQEAMLRVLKSEESVAMRLLAVDTLGRSQVRPERIFDALESIGDDQGGRAVRIRARERLGL